MISLETCAPALVPPARAAARTRYAQAAAAERTWIHVCMYGNVVKTIITNACIIIRSSEV